MTDSSDAAVLADLAQLKLDQGDTEGAQELFRKALEQQAQQQHGSGDAAAAGPAEEDDWEAWDEASVPVAAAAEKSAVVADSWDSAPAAAAAGHRRASASTAHRGLLASDDAGQEAAAEEVELQFGGGHVLEFYELTPADRTQHLEAFLERHAAGHQAPPTLRWVDDYHAAVICSDPAAARQLLAAAAKVGPAAEYKLRGYADAGSGTRKLPASELLPPKPRPKTSAAVARRLIGGALNLKLRDRDAEQQLTAARRQQRQERQERQKALDATWED